MTDGTGRASDENVARREEAGWFANYSFRSTFLEWLGDARGQRMKQVRIFGFQDWCCFCMDGILFR